MFHCLDRQTTFTALLIILYLLGLHVTDHILELLKRKDLMSKAIICYLVVPRCVIVSGSDRGLLGLNGKTVLANNILLLRKV